MKSTELKIGDWVFCNKNPIYPKIPTKVLEIKQDGIRIDISNIDYLDFEWVHLWDIEPIPLCRRILEGNDWEYSDVNPHNIQDLHSPPYPKGYLFYVRRDRLVFISTGEPPYTMNVGWTTLKIRFVHQLQHILWALGIDDNLKV